MFINRSRLVVFLLLAAVCLVMVWGGSTVSAQGPKLPTPVPATKTPTPVGLPKGPAAVATKPSSPLLGPTPAPALPAQKAAPTAKAPAAGRQRASRANAFASYSTGFQVQNLGTADASIQMTYYNQDGTVNGSVVNDTVPLNGSKTYATIAPAAGFNGSVIISSGQQIAAVVNVNAGGGAAWAAYDGSSTGSTSVSIPLLMQNNFGFNTWFNVQSAGGDTTVNVTYSDGTTASKAVKAGAAQTFNQATETHSSAVFSAVVSGGSVPIVATVIQEDTATLGAYSGFPSGSTNPVMPLINSNNFGYVTGAQIQNIGAASTDVTVTYTPSLAGASCTEKQTIPAGQSKTFALNVFTFAPTAGITTNCALGPTFVGSATVTTNSASQPLVAIVSQLLPGSSGELYGGFAPSTATNKVVFPLIMDRNFGYGTGFNVMNVGAASTSVNCVFSGTSYTASATLAAGQALTDVQTGKISSGYVGSATCTAGTGGQIVGIVNELGSGPAQLLVYEGINQ